MGFIDKEFNTPIYKEKEEEPKKLIIISCEGENTEPEYFEALKNNLSEYISVLVEIEIVPKLILGSQPKKVVENLEKYISDYDCQFDFDELWVVWDREEDDQRKKDILDVLELCETKNYNIAMANPLFEFWLLLHVADISKYDIEDLYKNIRISTKKRFIDKELSKILNGYKKKRGNFPKQIVSMENIKRAIRQEQLFETSLEKIIDNLGCNIGSLVRKIVNNL